MPPPTRRALARFEAAAGAKPGEYVFELPQSIPVERLRFDLPQENTVVSASLVAQERAGGPERRITSAVLYRMAHGEQKLVNAELQIPPTPEKRWVLRVDARGGGLGSGMPVLHAGWVPHRLVFVARGEPPFRIVFGNPDAAPAPCRCRPGSRPCDRKAGFSAGGAPWGGARAGSAQATAADTARGYFEQMDRKKLWLWGSLVLAVLVIVGMAWRLTRACQRRANRPAPTAREVR